MGKIKIFFFILLIFFSKNSYSAEKSEGFDGKGGREDLSFLNVKTSNFKKGNDSLNRGLKYKKKGKIEKANKLFEKALDYFVLANKEVPNNIEILKLLGFGYFQVGDTVMSEIYYNEGLSIEPKNNLLNQRLGELYFHTKRFELAKQKLDFLKTCNCKEYFELKNILNKN